MNNDAGDAEQHVFGCDETPSWLLQLHPAHITALASEGDVARMAVTLRDGASANAQNMAGQSALLLACKLAPDASRVDAVRLLLDHKADVNAFDSDKCTPLLAAACRGCCASMRLLLRAGASVDWHNVSGFTALHASCQMEQNAAVSLLLQSSAAVDSTTHAGGTPLAVASMVGSEQCAAILLASGACVNGAAFGPAPLYLAALNKRPACVRLLLDSRADVSTTSYGKTALQVAADDVSRQLLREADSSARSAADAAAAELLAEEDAKAVPGFSGAAGSKRKKKKKKKGADGADGADGGESSMGVTDEPSVGDRAPFLGDRAPRGVDEAIVHPSAPVPRPVAVAASAEAVSATSAGPSTWPESDPGEITSDLATLSLRAAGGTSAMASSAAGADVPSTGDGFLCVICIDAPKTRACVPCGHICVCERCAVPLKLCPICRSPFDSIMRIYLS